MSSSKPFPPRFKTPQVPQVVPEVVPQVPQSVKSGTKSLVTKWLPFIAAGTAVGVSVLALKELRKIKNEMILVKNQQMNVIFQI